MDGLADEMVRIGTITGEFWGARAVLSALEDADIPRFARLRDTWVRFSDDPLTDPCARDLYVRMADVSRAIEVLRALRHERASIDWDAFDVGAPAPSDSIATSIANDPDFQRRPSPMPRRGSRVVFWSNIATGCIVGVLVMQASWKLGVGLAMGMLAMGLVWWWFSRKPGSQSSPEKG